MDKPKVNPIANLPKPFLVLAPMFDVTDTVFRQIISEISSPDLTMSEFVNVDGLMSEGRNKLLPKIVFNPKEAPMVYQFWGKKPENYKRVIEQIFDYSMINSANELAGQSNLDKAGRAKIIGIDINMGCPEKSVLKNGCCAALMKDHSLTSEIIEASREGLGGHGSLSVKTRVGYSAIDLSWIKFLLSRDLDMLSIHLRTVKEMSKVPAHFELLDDIVAMRDELAPDTLIVANGDIVDKDHAHRLHKQYRIDGAMIGRGTFNNPFVFSNPKKWEEFSPYKKLELYKKQVELFRLTWKNKQRPIVTLNKFCKIYVNGFNGAKELRETLMRAKDAQDLLDKLETAKNMVKD